MYGLKKSFQYKISVVAKLMNKGRKVTQNLSLTNMTVVLKAKNRSYELLKQAIYANSLMMVITMT